MNHQHFWQPYNLLNEQALLIEINYLQYTVHKTPLYYCVSAQHTKNITTNTVHQEPYKPNSQPHYGSKPEHYITNKDKPVTILPALPHLPIKLIFSETQHLAPEEHIMLFVKLPLAINLYLGTQTNATLMADELTMPLKTSWYGSEHDVNGFLVHDWTTNAVFDLTAAQNNVNPNPQQFIYCPIVLRNQSHMVINLETTLIQTNTLNIYNCPAHNILISDGQTLTYDNSDTIERVPTPIHNLLPSLKTTLLTTAREFKTKHGVRNRFSHMFFRGA